MSRRIPTLREDGGTIYANRAPQTQSPSDWARGLDEEALFNELMARSDIPTFAQSAQPLSRHFHWDILRRSLSRPRARLQDDETSRPSPWVDAGPRASSPSRADSAAGAEFLLQSFEQHRRYNARARSTLQSHMFDRGRQSNDTTPSAVTWARLHRSEQQNPGSPYPAVLASSSQADLRSTYHQLFVENASLTRLKSSIRYLSKLRHCDSIEEGLMMSTDLAIDEACMAGQAGPSDRFSKLSDLIVDTTTLPRVEECSWLTPGMVFTGNQHSSRDSPPVMLHRHRNPDHHRDRNPQSRMERFHQDPLLALHERQRRHSYARVGTYRDRLPIPDVVVQHGSPDTNAQTQRIASLLPPRLQHLPSDHWPVTITLHDICLETLKLSGTMSATHIPSKLSPSAPAHNPHGSSMRSFFEGEIIDFRTHTLQTENFHTEDGDGDVLVDARYWRGVGPFRELLKKERARREQRKRWGFGGGGGGDGGGVGGGGEGAVRRQFGNDDDSAGDDDSNDDDDDPVVEDALGGEDVIASHLRSRSWIENVLLREWILMRWKERCFIKAGPAAKVEAGTASGTGAGVAVLHHAGGAGAGGDGANPTHDPTSWGLTISGFYYVALRRQTGEIDGLYYDPGSLPFQALELRPEGGGGNIPGTGARTGRLGVKTRFPAQQFR